MRTSPLSAALLASLLAVPACRDGTGADDRDVASVTLAPRAASVMEADTMELGARPLDRRGRDATGAALVWTSSDSSVAAVTGTRAGEGGEVLARVEGRAPGTAWIAVASGAARDSVQVTVRAAVESVEGWSSLTTGAGHTCALATDGRSFCWGRNHLGQLGTGPTDSTGVPRRVIGGTRFVRLSAAGTGTCGIGTAGTASCWGSWTGYPSVTPAPRGVAPGRTFREIHAGGTYGQACGLETAGSILCWQFWQSAGLQESTQPGPFTHVTASTPCGLTPDGRLLCWSQRVAGTPSDAGAPAGTVEAAGGLNLLCARDAAGTAACTTSYSAGVGGSGSPGGFAPVPGGLVFTQVSAALNRGCGVAADGQAFCWPVRVGFGAPGEIGAPASVGGTLRFRQVSAGDDHTCGITTQGAAYCWGNNQWGQLGAGTIGGSSAEPVRVGARNP